MSGMRALNVDFPFHFDGNGRTARTDEADHVHDMVEQLLFTSPGERVMRPDFGAGLGRLVFEPNSVELASALQFSLSAALQKWLGDVIVVNQVEVVADDAELRLNLIYTLRRTGEAAAASFPLPAP